VAILQKPAVCEEQQPVQTHPPREW
jgi:hypothetical protein